jgi:hypothetical protein
MTRKTSFITALGAALVLVPAAWGAPAPDVVERAAAQQQQQRDFWNYQSGTKVTDTSPGLAARDVAELFATERSGPADPWLAQERRDLSAQARRAIAVPTAATGSDNEFEWLQIGIGLGAGILLAFGLFLGLRLINVRPLAH